MTALARSSGESGALFTLSGTVPSNATWAEDIFFYEAGAPPDISQMSWKLTFRQSDLQTSADFALSTDDGTLSVVLDADSGVYCILRITVTAGTFGSYVGDYIADLASKDADNVVQLWAHGIVS